MTTLWAQAGLKLQGPLQLAARFGPAGAVGRCAGIFTCTFIVPDYPRAVRLLRARHPARAAGWWLGPCAAAHAVSMHYPIDVVFMDCLGRVIRRVPALAPLRRPYACGWSLSLSSKAGSCDSKTEVYAG